MNATFHLQLSRDGVPLRLWSLYRRRSAMQRGGRLRGQVGRETTDVWCNHLVAATDSDENGKANADAGKTNANANVASFQQREVQSTPAAGEWSMEITRIAVRE